MTEERLGLECWFLTVETGGPNHMTTERCGSISFGSIEISLPTANGLTRG